jgi:methionyl-tRNA formyltransferase
VQGKHGEIVAIGEQAINIAVQGGVVEILKVRTDAGQKLSAAAFAKSHELSVGDRMESDGETSLAAVG